MYVWRSAGSARDNAHKPVILDTHPAFARESGLVFDDVTKGFMVGGETIPAAVDVSLSVERGELVALYGPSGSGKSTLLMLAAGWLAPDHGSIRFDGAEVSTLDDGALTTFRRENVGYIAQCVELMPGVPALENAGVPLLGTGSRLREARERALPLLKRLGLEHRVTHTPDRLSGGERQRVAIARALISEPNLLLADEPTSSLDSQRGQDVLEFLAEAVRVREMSMLLVTHDPAAAAIADRVLTLTDGRISSAPIPGLR